MHLIEKDYETLAKEIEKNKEIIYIDYSLELNQAVGFLTTAFLLNMQLVN